MPSKRHKRSRSISSSEAEDESKKTRKIRKSNRINRQKVDKGVVKISNYRKSCRGLPTEIIDHIFSYCNRNDLTKVARASKTFQLRSNPLLYRQFQPRFWPFIISVSRNIQRNLASSSIDTRLAAQVITKAIRAIDLPHFELSSEPHESDFISNEIASSLLTIIKLSNNLKSIRWDTKSINNEDNDIWKALQYCPLVELQITERNFMFNQCTYNVTSDLWNLKNLRILDLTIPWCSHATNNSPMTGLCKLVEGCSSLKELTCLFRDHHFTSYNTATVNGDQLFQLPVMSTLEKINFEGIFATSKEKMKDLLSRLKSVQQLRLVHGNSYRHGSTRFTQEENFPTATLCVHEGTTVALPYLQELESNLCNIKAITSKSTPGVIRNVRVQYEPGSSLQNGDISFFSTCTSLKELHLNFYTRFTNVRLIREQVAATLCQIPISVEKLSICFPLIHGALYLDHSEQDICLLQWIKQLSNLKVIALPWNAIKEAPAVVPRMRSKIWNSSEKEDTPLTWAKIIGENLANLCPSLEYIYFQGSQASNATGDPAWQVKWGEMEDLGKRWTLKIHRKTVNTFKIGAQEEQQISASSEELARGGKIETGSKNKVSKKKKVKRSSSCKQSTNQKVEEVRIEFEIEVLSTSCPCSFCFSEEGMGSGSCYLDSDSEDDLMYGF